MSLMNIWTFANWPFRATHIISNIANQEEVTLTLGNEIIEATSRRTHVNIDAQTSTLMAHIYV